MKRTFKFSFEDRWDYPELDNLKIGDPVLVYCKENILSGSEKYYISSALAEEGYPGNTDSSVKRFHGWRGTTNDISVYAFGVYAIDDIQEIGEYLKIHIGKSDLKKGEE